MILDFNSKNLDFSLDNITKYDIKTIDKNILKYQQFLHDKAIDATFEKVFQNDVFMMTMLDEQSNNLHDLSLTYNSVAKIIGEPQITKTQLKNKLENRGYTIYKTTQWCNGTRRCVRKVTKPKNEDLPLW